MSLYGLAAGCGSPTMIDLLLPGFETLVAGWTSQQGRLFLTAAIQGNNIETFWLLFRELSCAYSNILPELRKSKSEELHRNWEIHVDAEYEKWARSESNGEKSIIPFSNRYTSRALLKTAKADPDNEAFILLLWDRLNLSKESTEQHLGSVLVAVADTCCSVKLAKYLIEAGAPVDHRRSSSYSTPLHRALKHNTPEAAELVKYLLGMGADPAAKMEDESGAKGISKWLGMSWDDLVKSIKTKNAAREKLEEEIAEPAAPYAIGTTLTKEQ
ncbi:hypothetical protein EG329_009958 [Mollisiaceae sp. DMI_Dod_QoI]|nr:hypothetical protein EG329_009958 [Helotiales sp. DMI_Dod_QoI]